VTLDVDKLNLVILTARWSRQLETSVHWSTGIQTSSQAVAACQEKTVKEFEALRQKRQRFRPECQPASCAGKSLGQTERRHV